VNEIVQTLESYKQLVLYDEDGVALTLESRAGVTEAEFNRFEAAHDTLLPQELRELLAYSDGFVLFGIEIFSLKQVHCYPQEGLFAFHEWGNGDFDAIRVSENQVEDGAILFVNHSPDVAVKVASNLIEWLRQAGLEVQRYGTLLHPMDYQQRSGVSGLYSHVVESLAGVDCELNRG